MEEEREKRRYRKGRKEKDRKAISNLLYLNWEDKKRQLEELRISQV